MSYQIETSPLCSSATTKKRALSTDYDSSDELSQAILRSLCCSAITVGSPSKRMQQVPEYPRQDLLRPSTSVAREKHEFQTFCHFTRKMV